jgi:NADPH:quinone reductase-like Zn-dependent oxidoreductase
LRAVVFEKQGLENLQVLEVAEPEIGDYDVLIEVKLAGVNPIDYNVVTNLPNVKPMPHIPGTEFAGIITKLGRHVTKLKEGQRTTVYTRTFDGTCPMCLAGTEMLCQHGGMISRSTNGGFAQYVAVPAKCALPIPDDLNWELAASLPVGALTSYHALRQVDLKVNETFVVFGSSGNTGLFALQLGKRFGAKVLAVSGKPWVAEFGADYVIPHEGATEKIFELTHGALADVVLNSLGTLTWQAAFDSVAPNGRLTLFGTLTGKTAELALDKVYNKQIKIIGSTGGTRQELTQLINNANYLKTKIWKIYPLEEAAQALKDLNNPLRQGRIMIKP